MGVIENVGNIAELVKKIGDIELYKKILALETEVRELTRDKRRADDKVEELERMLTFSKELSFKAPFYYTKGDATPYRPGCWESKSIAIHVTQHQQYTHLRQCPSCKHSYDPDSA